MDTLRAENLKTAWSKRQEELKIAMASVAKPAEFMAEIAFKLRENNQSLGECVESLRELESLLGDIDNARDFYTIGKLINSRYVLMLFLSLHFLILRY